jgi:hypothetical protein
VGSGSILRSIISKENTTHTRNIDPQRTFGPQFPFDGAVDLKSLDICARYGNASGTRPFGKDFDSFLILPVLIDFLPSRYQRCGLSG